MLFGTEIFQSGSMIERAPVAIANKSYGSLNASIKLIRPNVSWYVSSATLA
jgi:hypothetical protein